MIEGTGGNGWTGGSLGKDETAPQNHSTRAGLPIAPVRAALVESLRDAVRGGTYAVDCHALAARMLPVLFPSSCAA